jgi:excisionase family DNA binding protein
MLSAVIAYCALREDEMVAEVKLSRGLTVAEVARRYRVGPDKVRAWIRSGELAAINTAAMRCGKPRFVVTEESLASFERARNAAVPAAPKRRRDRKPALIDFYPSAN